MKKLLLILSLILFSVSSFSQSSYISKITKKVVYSRDGGVCQCCGDYEYLEYDYISPYSCGSGTDISNIQLLCRECNRSKSNSCYCKIHNKKVGACCVESCMELHTFRENFPVSNGSLVNHTYYSLSYSEQYKQAEWTFYEIKKERILGLVSRTNDFRSDEMISTNSATLSDYGQSGYDRGHLVPAGDMSFSTIAMSESFYMSNMSPQHPSFNRGIWKNLESLVRSWGSNSSIYVATGPVLNDCSTTIGSNNVCVPEYYYKVIYDPSEQKMIAFVLSNKKAEYTLSHYVTSVGYVEEITGINFFSGLEDELEKRLESHKEYWIDDEK
jgi:endonuclease G|tara:strand:+ start:2612 stop:3592 length:981 start_codon:yes stop_codon:yes gene_type:complete